MSETSGNASRRESQYDFTLKRPKPLMSLTDFAKWAMLFTGLLFLILWLMSTDGKVLYTFKTTLDKIGDTVEVVSDAWVLGNDVQVVEVELSTSNFPQDSTNNAYVVADIYQADTEVLINSVEADFYFIKKIDFLGKVTTESGFYKNDFFKVDSTGVFVAVLRTEEKTRNLDYSYTPVQLTIKEGNRIRIGWYGNLATYLLILSFALFFRED